MPPATPIRKSPAQDAVDAVALQPTFFYVRKKTIRPMLHALTGTQPNQFQPHGAPGLQDRTDLSGKFARRLGAIRRALSKIDDEIIVPERKELTKLHAAKFPDFEPDGTTPHPKAGQPTPVYATDQAGAPMFVKDRAGNDTDERIVMPDQFNLADPQAFEREFKDLLNEFVVVECVGFTEDDFNAFKSSPQQNSPIGKIVDALSDLIRGEECDATPEEQAVALEARAASLMQEAARIREKDASPGLAVAEEASETAEEDPSPSAP